MSSSSVDSNISSYSHKVPSPALIAMRNKINSSREEFLTKTVESHSEEENNLSSSSSSSESEEEQTCKVVIPKKRRHKKSNTQEILTQLIIQHKEASNMQKKMYKLQSELDKEEITCRYVKLDLANSQARVGELRLKIVELNKTISKIDSQSQKTFILICVLIVFYVFGAAKLILLV
jgi:hypothetical protein